MIPNHPILPHQNKGQRGGLGGGDKEREREREKNNSTKLQNLIHTNPYYPNT